MKTKTKMHRQNWKVLKLKSIMMIVIIIIIIIWNVKNKIKIVKKEKNRYEFYFLV